MDSSMEKLYFVEFTAQLRVTSWCIHVYCIYTKKKKVLLSFTLE